MRPLAAVCFANCSNIEVDCCLIVTSIKFAKQTVSKGGASGATKMKKQGDKLHDSNASRYGYREADQTGYRFDPISEAIGDLHCALANNADAIANASGGKVTRADVARRLVELLETSPIWQSRRDTAMVPEVRPNGHANSKEVQLASAYARSAPTTDDSPRRRRTLAPSALKAISRAQRARWKQYHEKKEKERARWARSSAARRARGNKKQSTSRYKANRVTGMKSFWARLTPKQRSDEMKRRRNVAAAKNIAALRAQLAAPTAQ